MKILVLGGDGYLGWPTCMSLSNEGYEVFTVDNYSKRKIELEMGFEPLQKILPLQQRAKLWNKISGKKIKVFIGDLCNHKFTYNFLKKTQPDAIIHFAEQPSAPYSMASREKAYFTQYNNVMGNLNLLFGIRKYCKETHLIKIGTMGEYGTPNIDIEEGWLNIKHNGRKEKILFPKKPGSYYHLSKVFDSYNIEFCCRSWGLRTTDLNQGIVYGIETNETILHKDLATSFHYDEVFGTILNRFISQSVIGNDITVYGSGKQIRSFLNIKDTMQCIKIALKNSARKSEYRVFNQFTECFSVNELAKKIIKIGKNHGSKSKLKKIKNPRVEMSEHYYNPKSTNLKKLGLKPNLLSDDFLNNFYKLVNKSKSNIKKSAILPKISW